MKAILQPLYFKSGMDDEFKLHLDMIREFLKNEASIINPLELGKPIKDADAVIFPQLIGDAFKQVDLLKKIKLPLLVTTSDFGTVNMWDWEIVTFLKTEGLKIFAPYSLDLTKNICRSLALKREMKKTKFLVFQDNPGVGMQAEIFRRFYWWEEKCEKSIKDKFGISIVRKSFKELAEKAKKISDSLAIEVAKDKRIHIDGVSNSALLGACKMYLAVRDEVEKDPDIKGAGINCLNESFYSDTTPCLAWSLLYEEKGLVWSCEADTMSLMTMYLIQKSIGADIIMSNIYPFLLGMAALKHERIEKFPEVDEPENYLLVVHCGYFALIPKCIASEWTLREKVLKIVDKDATVIDAKLPLGKVLITKLHPNLNELMVFKGSLENYVQYPGSDCRNGGLVKVKDGYRLMDLFYSHHNCIMVGDKSEDLKYMSKVFDIDIVR